MDRRRLLAAGAAAFATPALASAAPPRGFVIDTLTIGGPDSVDGRDVLAAGMDALVVDMTIFPRAPAEATDPYAEAVA